MDKKEYQKAYRDAHKEKTKAYNLAYKLKNEEHLKEYRKAYYKTNFKKIQEYHKSRPSFVREQKKSYLKAYYRTNLDKRKIYKELHKEEIRAKQSERRKTNRDKLRIREAAYRKSNPLKIQAWKHKRRALKFGTGHEAYNGLYIFERDNWTCGICGRKINKRLKYPNALAASIDHIIPLSRSGKDNPGNVQASHLRCNLGKNNKLIGQLLMFG